MTAFEASGTEAFNFRYSLSIGAASGCLRVGHAFYICQSTAWIAQCRYASGFGVSYFAIVNTVSDRLNVAAPCRWYLALFTVAELDLTPI
jgi:hypothetical protein